MLAGSALTQQPPSSTPGNNAPQNSSEISSHDESATFRVNVNLVLVRVVARDPKGVAVGNLKKEDFELLDNRKPQVISRFSVESGTPKAPPQASASNTSGEQQQQQEQVALPDRYIAYLFDDIHLNLSDLMQVRNAASRHLATLQPTDRAAIFTTSGRTTLDFTADKEKLLNTLLHLNASPLTRSAIPECPDVTYYVADMIQNKHDSSALQMITQEALQCHYNNDPQYTQQAQQEAQITATRELTLGDHESQVAIYTIQDVVKRIAFAPGQRNIILVSPGFLNPDFLREQGDLGDRAVRANVVINTLDARGLYTVDPAGDISQPGFVPVAFAALQTQYAHASASADADILAELADATGGTFFHNSNDLEGGLRRLASPPEYSYLLGFSPSNLKMDGKYHNIKVTIKSGGKLTIQARKGYFAPAHEMDAAEQAKQDIEDALFSKEEFHAVPVDLHTQFFKASDTSAQIAVLVHVDLRGVHFKKVDGRNRNDLTVVSALFDPDGNYITGTKKTVEMRLRDETLERTSRSGITLKSNFDVKPGTYLVRLVVRDAEGAISAENRSVQIPY